MKPRVKEKMSLKTELVSGTERIYPSCEISRGVCAAFALRCLKPREVHGLIDVYDIEYSGRKRADLDEFGAKYVE